MSAGRRRLAIAVLPYVAVVVGLHIVSNAWVAMLGYQAGMVLLLRGADWRALTRGWNGALGIPALAACALTGPALLILFPLVARSGGLAEPLAALGLQSTSLLAFAAVYCLANSWLEELAWRGKIDGRTPPAWSDVAFAAYHALVLILFIETAWVIATVALLTITAWLWRAIALRTGGLAIPAASHLIANVSLMWAVLRLV